MTYTRRRDLVRTAESSVQACGLCGSTEARLRYPAKDRLGGSDREFWIAECSGCGVLRTLPAMSEEELAAFYPNDYWGAENDPSQAWISSSQSDKLQFLGSCNLASGRILDVGCGSGFFLRALNPARWERFGVELGAGAVEASRRALGRDCIIEGTLEEAGYPDSEFDVVTLWSALEYTNQPRRTLIEVKRILKPGGSLVVQVPNAASYQLRLFSGSWFALDVPRHRYHFTPVRLEQLLSEVGLSTYRKTFFSKAHNAHALKQSLKTELYAGQSTRALFYLAVPFIKPFDLIMSALGRGATLTIAAQVVVSG